MDIYFLFGIFICLVLVYIFRGGETYAKNIKSNNPKSIHLWGDSKTEFKIDENDVITFTGSGKLSYKRLPHLLPTLRKLMYKNFKKEEFLKTKCERPKFQLYENENFENFLNKNGISFTTDHDDLLYYSHGQLSVDEVTKIMYDKNCKINCVDIVVRPMTEVQIMTIIDEACKNKYKIIPFGGGTNVTGCLKIVDKSIGSYWISIDMRSLIIKKSINTENRFAILSAGMTGLEIENYLNTHGFTCGHEPDSYEYSTLGGWIATYASGMKRGLYGNIEDIVLGFKAIIAHEKAEMINCNFESNGRFSHGTRLDNLFYGSEGNFGIITSVKINIKPLPDVKKYESLIFKSMDDGLLFLRTVYSKNLVPASIRLVDNLQFQLGHALTTEKYGLRALEEPIIRFVLDKLYGWNNLVACTIVFEGTEEYVHFQHKQILEIARIFGGMSGGEAKGKSGYLLTHSIAYIRDFFNEYSIIAETFETTCAWSDVIKMTKKMNEVCIDKAIELGIIGKPFLSYRVTQLYNSSVCLYFTLGFLYIKDDFAEVYAKMEKALRDAMMKYNTSISHHHGIGKLKTEYLNHSEKEKQILRRVGLALNPVGVIGSHNNIFH